MRNPYALAPHQGGAAVAGAPHAALLIDFDNVTMGMRSDLSKELKTLLASDVIKGKVSVQRAYADWRRYPQYIVPLSEASVDLIFAPAYGSNKKNATDIRMAIDALELVFIRPEIGTFILLTGDSDFSSLVLKLKEYGKYVIGVGIQESTSDILVQNCDEYYSYTTLTGLRKTTEADQRAEDPWVLVRDALKQMVDRSDVMRSDRLKQVMQEIDPTFDESGHGFSKFSKFLAEAASRGLVKLQKLDNGQYEVSPARGGRGGRKEKDEGEGRGRERGRGRGERRERELRPTQQAAAVPTRDEPETIETIETTEVAEAAGQDPLQGAYALMTRALEQLKEAGRDPVRDSDVKRKILEIDGSFDETELGFPKFSKFLSQAEEHGVVRLSRNDAGNFEVGLRAGDAPSGAKRDRGARKASDHGASDADGSDQVDEGRTLTVKADSAPEKLAPGPTVVEFSPSEPGDQGLRLGPRRGSTRRRDGDDGLVLLPGQGVPAHQTDVFDRPSSAEPPTREDAGPASRGHDGSFDAAELGLPTDPEAIVRYLTHRYRGVGEKTAELLVERFGSGLFGVLRDDPAAINDAVTPKRAEQVLEAWQIDYERRRTRRSGSGGNVDGGEGRSSERGGRRGGRRRGSRGRTES
jgi:uncharacterized protein (TIGR00288 family)